MTLNDTPDRRSLDEIMAEALADIGNPTPGIPTGYASLDKLLCGGLHPGELTVLAGQTGTGSSTLALDILRTCAIKHGLPACLVTSQTAAATAVQRIAAAEARIPAARLRAGTLNDVEQARLAARVAEVAAAPLYIASNAEGALYPLLAGIVEISGLRLAVVDGADRINSVELKKTAMGSGVPILAVCTLARPDSVVDRAFLKHLNEGFVQTADAVILFEDLGAWYADEPGKVRLTVAKHRNGPCGEIELIHDARHARFLEPSGDA